MLIKAQREIVVIYKERINSIQKIFLFYKPYQKLTGVKLRTLLDFICTQHPTVVKTEYTYDYTIGEQETEPGRKIQQYQDLIDDLHEYTYSKYEFEVIEVRATFKRLWETICV